MMGFGFVGRRAKKTPGKIPSSVKARAADRRAERGIFTKTNPARPITRTNKAQVQESHYAPSAAPIKTTPKARRESDPETRMAVSEPFRYPEVPAEPKIPMQPHDANQSPSKILMSAVLSIHNRSVLFRRALDGYMTQTLSPENWEIILLDDMSTEDLRKTYRHLIGKANIRHVLVDHTRHPVFLDRNPGWRPGMPASWYHTPAITMNIGFSMAKGGVLCLCHPEILHAPQNFQNAIARLSKERVFAFGTTWLGNQSCNDWLSKHSWTEYGWPGFLSRVGANTLRKYSPKELYWYTSFLPKEAAVAVRGVDFEYLNGVAGEDDDFKERVRLAGWEPIHAPDIEGFHQDHSHETEAHHRRDTKAWRVGLKTNRALFASRKEQGFPQESNSNMDWTSSACVVDVLEHAIS